MPLRNWPPATLDVLRRHVVDDGETEDMLGRILRLMFRPALPITTPNSTS